MPAKDQFILTPIPTYDSVNFEAWIKNEVEGLHKNRPDSEFFKAYNRANYEKYRGRGGLCHRGGRLKKMAFARYLIAMLIQAETGRSFACCYGQADSFLDDKDSTWDLSTAYQYKKSRVRLPCPEIDISWEAGERLEKIDKDLDRTIKILPFPYHANVSTEAEADKLKQEDRLARRILKILFKSPGISRRGLCRKLNETLQELRPLLDLLRADHVIDWDPKKATLNLVARDPADRRKFKWTADSCSPQWGPHLEKGRVYNYNQFRSYVVDEWARQGAASVLEPRH